ncbi:MAG: hypothetical protein WC140_01665 [Bacteroidales bacterium]
MENNIRIIINSLKKKLNFLISQYEILLRENHLLNESVSKYKQELESINNRNKRLEEKTEKLRLTEAFSSSSEDVLAAKKELAKLVREIDKCIALLNE